MLFTLAFDPLPLFSITLLLPQWAWMCSQLFSVGIYFIKGSKHYQKAAHGFQLYLDTTLTLGMCMHLTTYTHYTHQHVPTHPTCTQLLWSGSNAQWLGIQTVGLDRLTAYSSGFATCLLWTLENSLNLSSLGFLICKVGS